MLRDNLLSIRPIEDLILCRNSKARVSGEIVRYLWTHQIDGIRRMYLNYKNVSNSSKRPDLIKNKHFLLIFVCDLFAS